jgi:AbrB family looped-hinge helix DNA binding protein
MATVTMSSKCQIVTPREIREALDIKPGQKLSFLRDGPSVRMIRVPKIEDMKGMFPGIDGDVPRDDDRV